MHNGLPGSKSSTKFAHLSMKRNGICNVDFLISQNKEIKLITNYNVFLVESREFSLLVVDSLDDPFKFSLVSNVDNNPH